jgi:DNA (cytosine-5)-methyltransferase 1
MYKGINTEVNEGQTPIVSGLSVRRLTVTECERLQGFPDHYTEVANAKDAPRYKALGNSMAVPVVRWIGERIARAEGQE